MTAKRAVCFTMMCVLLAAAPGSQAFAGGGGVVSLNACTTITRSGMYVLSQNLSSNTICLKVAARFVTIDLNGLSISGKGAGSGVSDNGVAQQGVVVRNGIITNFATGVDLGSSSAARVEEVQLIGNTATGAAVGSGGTVADCTITGGMDGIATGIGGDIDSNNVAGASDHGIDAGSGNTVRGNTVTGGGNVGIEVDCPSTVVQNTATDTPTGCTPAVNCSNLVLNGAGCTNSDNTAP